MSVLLRGGEIQLPEVDLQRRNQGLRFISIDLPTTVPASFLFDQHVYRLTGVSPEQTR